MTYFRWDDRLFNVGDVIPPGRFGRILVGFGPSHKEWRREIVTEFVRTVTFPRRPSRLSGLLAFTDRENAEQNFHTFATRPATYCLYELVPAPTTIVFVAAEWQLHEVVQALSRNDLQAAIREARQYWEGGAHSDGLMEVIASTGLSVARILASREVRAENRSAGDASPLA